MASLDGKLYAAGGTSGIECFSSAECYDPVTDTWTPIAPLSMARAFHGMSAFETKIYACCGKDSNNALLSSVEAYDPRTGVWSRCTPTQTLRRAMQVVAC